MLPSNPSLCDSLGQLFSSVMTPYSDKSTHSLAYCAGAPLGMVRCRILLSIVTFYTGTASSADFTVNTAVVNLQRNAPISPTVQVTFNVDGIALEKDETFQIQLQSDQNLDSQNNFFFINTVTLTILDEDSMLSYHQFC